MELDETLLEISTDKVDSEVPSPARALVEILVPEGETVEVGAPIAVIATGRRRRARRAAARPAEPTAEFFTRPEHRRRRQDAPAPADKSYGMTGESAGAELAEPDRGGPPSTAAHAAATGPVLLPARPLDRREGRRLAAGARGPPGRRRRGPHDQARRDRLPRRPRAAQRLGAGSPTPPPAPPRPAAPGTEPVPSPRRHAPADPAAPRGRA